MKLKSALFAATLALFVASTATAFAAVEQRTDAQAGQAETAKARNSESEKPENRGGHMEGKTDTPATFSMEELFGCKPMGENGHMPMPGQASGVSKQGPMQPVQ